MKMSYQDLFSYALPLGEHAIENHDGSVSIAVLWNGLTLDKCGNDAEIQQKFIVYYDVLKKLSEHMDVTIENHLFRTSDKSLADKYIEYGEKNVIRSKELGLFFRKELADHLSSYGRKNTVITVFTMQLKNKSIFKSAKNIRQQMRDNVDYLYKVAEEITATQSNSLILTANEYARFVLFDANKDRYLSDPDFKLSDRFYINQQLIKKPDWEDGLLKLGETYTRVILLLDYPDSNEIWFTNTLAKTQGVDLSVVQILKPLDVAKESLKSAHEANKMVDAATSSGGEDTAGKLAESNDFRSFVSNNNLAVFSNCYVIKLSSNDKNKLLSKSQFLERNLSSQGASFSSDVEEVARVYYRVSMLGQGHYAPFSRPDHHLQIAFMSPLITFDEGETADLQMLRLTSTGQLVGDNFKPNAVHHRVTAAKTGSGKTVYHAGEICELFPLGYNFYITEVGRGFEWVVQLFGGDYYVLDAEKTVISPFPAYSLEYEKDEEESEESILPAYIVGATISAIMPILLDSSDYDNLPNIGHFKAAAENILQACYLPDFRGKFDSPTLEDFLNTGLKTKEYLETDSQREAADSMLDNLKSFLGRSEGSIFKKADSIDFSKPIIGIDFSVLLEAENNDLAKYLLTFVAMRFRQLSFIVDNPCFCIFDEHHEYTDIDPVLMAKVERQMTKRGRKKGAFFSPISQAVADMNTTDSGESSLNQYTHKNLMYYGTEFGNVPDLFKLPQRAIDIWSSYLDPLENSYNYRQCLRVKGEQFFDLHLTYPQVFNDLTNSNPDAVALKEAINKEESDTIKKLTLFRERYV